MYLYLLYISETTTEALKQATFSVENRAKLMSHSKNKNKLNTRLKLRYKIAAG